MAVRPTVERLAAGPMRWLVRRRILVFVVFLAAVIATFALGGPVSLAVGLPLAAFVGLVCYLSWPLVDERGRLLRAAVVAVVTAAVALHAAMS